MSQASELNRRGVLLKQQGQVSAAAECYEQAVRLDPNFAEAHFNLGLLRRSLGQLDLALDSIEKTAALRPDVPAVRYELGQLYLMRRRWSDAEHVFQELSQTQTLEHEAVLCLAIAQQEMGKLAEAASAYLTVLKHQPQHAVALTNLGHILKSQGKLAESIDCFEQAIQANPDLVEAHVNLGNSWLEMGCYEAAYTEYLVAAELQPTDAQAHVNLGNVLQRLDRSSDSAAAYQRAIELNSGNVDAWVNVTHLFKELGDFVEARRVSQELAHRMPSQSVHALRAAAICPHVFRDRDDLECYREQLTAIVNTSSADNWELDFSRWTVYAPECPYNLQFLDGDLSALKIAFANVYVPFFAKFVKHPAARQMRRAKPRIGFVVTARHEQAFVKLFGGVLNRLNPERWELVVLCSQLGAEKLRRSLRHPEVTIAPFPERFDHVVATVRDAACDLLYYWEVGNDPTNYFLPFLRLAPVQVTSWGIQVTTGIPNVDYYLSSHLVEAPDADRHYSEQLVRASTLLTYQEPVQVPRIQVREAHGLSSKQHVYGCIQNLGKFHPDFDAVLAEILRQDPDGVVVAARDHNGFAAEILQRRWKTMIPDVASRLRLVDPLSQPEYLSLLGSCDVLLDPLHFGGVTTTYDALALSQPIVTLPTEFHRGRYTSACLRKIGVTETIAADIDDYVKIAVELASDAERRRSLRERLRSASGEAFEDQAAIGEHERIFEELLSSGR